MKTPHSHILIRLLFALLVLPAAGALQSCSSDIEEPGPAVTVPAGKAMAEFLITVGDIPETGQSRAAGRATPTDGPYDPGTGYENYIDILGGDFHFYLLSGETDGSRSRFMGELSIGNLIPIYETDYSRTYRVRADVPQYVLDSSADLGSFRIMVLANWGEYTEPEAGVTTIDQLCAHQNAVFAYSQEKAQLGADNPIPLYGIKHFTGVSFDRADYTQLGTIYLLRAYAKVDVRVDSDRWSLSSVTMTKYRPSGYKAPEHAYDETDYVHGSYDLDYTAAPYLPSGSPRSDLAFAPAAADSSVYRIYVPEYRNTDDLGAPLAESSRARIRVTFRDRYTGLPSYMGEKYIDFKYYQAPDRRPELQGKHMDIMRNNWYRFTITKDDEEGDVTVRLDVQPYASVELAPGFGLERDPIDGYIVLKKIMQGGAELPTFMYDDRFGEYYDFQKYRLTSNYSNNIGRASDDIKAQLGLSGDIWLIKRANHHTDDIGDSNTKPSLLYDAGTGIYYDYKGEPLNVMFVNTSPRTSVTDTLKRIVDVDRDFQFNNFVLARGDNSVESAFYDFAHGNYKGAFDPDSSEVCLEDLGTTDDLPENEKLKNFMRRPTNRLAGGWIEIVPYWLIETPRVCRLYYNIYTDRYYDREGYCLQDETVFPDFEFNVSENNPYVVLKRDSRERATLYYRRDDAKYYSITYVGNTTTEATRTVVSRPEAMVRDPRLPILNE